MTPRSGNGATWPAGFHVTVVAETGSTNADLLMADAATPHRSVLIADHQTAGRGRLDRTWESGPERAERGRNLMMSVLLRTGLERPHRWTQRVALAARQACEQVAGVTPELKWPNDLLLDGRKLAGILAVAGSQRGRIDRVVVGIGLNVAWAPDSAAMLPGGRRDEVAAALLTALADMDDDHLGAYRGALSTLGRRVRVEQPHGELTGLADDVDDDGRLLVRAADGPHWVSVGDIVHLRPVD